MPRPTLRPTPAINPTQPIGLWRQFFLALSLMLGAGVFVGIGMAIEVAEAGIFGAVTLAALLALINQAVLAQPVASATSERLLIEADWQHFTADWTLFLARLTAVASAILGLAGYLLKGFQLTDPIWLVPIALAVEGVLIGASFRYQPPRKSTEITVILATVALLGLILAGLPVARLNPQALTLSSWHFGSGVSADGASGFASIANLLQATAFMSVAYASEQNHPAVQSASRRQTSRAFRYAIVLAWFLYLGVAVVSLSTLGTPLDNKTEAWIAPLSNVIQSLPLPGGVFLITLGAVAGMAGIVMRLLPELVSAMLKLNQSPTLSILLTAEQSPDLRLSPRLAKLLITLALGCVVLVGDLKTTWSFSAFTFLLSAALMHSIALRQNSAAYPRWQHWLGLTSCLFLAFWVNWDVWLVSLGLVALALIWRGVQYWSEDP